MWGVLKSKEKEQLDADRRQPSVQHSNCKYCIKLWRHMTRVDNWIIKACLTKAWAPPPIWKGMSKVCDLLHLCALIPLVGVGLKSAESASPSAVISSFHLQEGQFFCQFYLVLWQRESRREMVPHICSKVSLKCLLKSSLWGSGCGLKSSLMYLRTLEAGNWDIQYVSVQPKSLNILPIVTEQAFWCACVCICIQENDQMTLPGLLQDICDCHMQVLIHEPAAEFIQDPRNSHRTF